MVEMQFVSLGYDSKRHSPIIVLTDCVTKKKELVIPVGSLESMILSLALNREYLPNPLIHDLFLQCLTALDCQITHTEITSYKNGIFSCYLALENHEDSFRLDARVADGITLSVRQGFPIYVNELVWKNLSDEAAEASKTGLRPAPIVPDGATEMLRNVSAHHVLSMMSAARHNSNVYDLPLHAIQEEQLLELLRCLEPETREKM